MQRLWSGVWLMVVLTTTMAPSLALLHFHLHRTYIERELCVQRAVAADMRTCHGECHLAKQLKALEQESQESFPGPRLDLRTDPAVQPTMRGARVYLQAFSICYPRIEPSTAEGFTSSLDPVPWA